MSFDTSCSAAPEITPDMLTWLFFDVLLLDRPQQLVLLELDEKGRWWLPRFEYENFTSFRRIKPICDDFKKWAGIEDDHIFFTAVVELVGETTGFSKYGHGIGDAELLVMEAQGVESVSDLRLPENIYWKDLKFVENNLCVAYSIPAILKRICSCIGKALDISTCNGLSDARHRPRWLDEASRFLEESIVCDGAQMVGSVSETLHVSYIHYIKCGLIIGAVLLEITNGRVQGDFYYSSGQQAIPRCMCKGRGVVNRSKLFHYSRI